MDILPTVLRNLENLNLRMLKNNSSTRDMIAGIAVKPNSRYRGQSYDNFLNNFLNNIDNDNNCINILNNIKPLINKLEQSFNENIKIQNDGIRTVNSKTIKPLELIARETIQENDIQTDDPTVNAVLEQPFDVNTGGRRRRKKKTRKNKRY